MVRRTSTVNFERIAHIQDKLELVPGDLLDEVSMITILREHRPSEVYNLAAQSFVPPSWSQPVFTGETTALGVTRISRRRAHRRSRHPLLQASSSEMFARSSRYRRARTHPSTLGRLRRREGVRPLDHRELPRVVRLARHERDPLQPRIAAPRSRVRRAQSCAWCGADQARALQRVALGNLEGQRDWGFAGDYVEAMWLMLQQPESGNYVVSTDETHSVRELCEIAFSHVGLNYEDHVVQDERFFRPAGGRSPHRRLVEDARRARMEAPRRLRRTRPHDGRRRHRAPQERAAPYLTTVLAGGVGAARFLRGLVDVVPAPT